MFWKCSFTELTSLFLEVRIPKELISGNGRLVNLRSQAPRRFSEL
jgi:hypothetical protein